MLIMLSRRHEKFLRFFFPLDVMAKNSMCNCKFDAS